MSTKSLFLLLDNNYLKLSSLPFNKFQIEKREIDNSYQIGYEYLIFFSDKESYRMVLWDARLCTKLISAGSL